MKPEGFEEFLSKTLKSAEIQSDASDEQLQTDIYKRLKEYRERRIKRNRRAWQVTAGLTLALVILAGTLFPQSVLALKGKILNTITQWGTEVRIGYSGHQPPIQPEDPMDKAVSEMQPSIPFKILIPRYIPAGFVFTGIEKSPQHEKPTIIITFSSQNSAIQLSETQLSDHFNLDINIGGQQAKAEKMQIGRYECNVLTFKDGSLSLIWFTDDNIKCELSGDLAVEAAQQMVLSIEGRSQ
jgi:hypothetical protein